MSDNLDNMDDDIALHRARQRRTWAIIAAGVVGAGVLACGIYLISTALSTSDKAQSAAATPQQVAMTDEQRKALQAQLNAAEQAIDELLANKGIESWAPERTAQLSSALEGAYNAYGSGRYQVTKDALERVSEATDKLASDYVKAYTLHFEQAKKAFAAGDILTARERNRQALNINAEYAEAIALQQRLDVYEQAQKLENQARTGEVENNVRKARDAYRQLVALDPTPARQAKLNQLNEQIRQLEFAAFTKQAVAALDAGDYQQAAAKLDKAENLISGSSEVATLRSRISDASKAQAAAAIESQLKVFAQADEWATVKLMAEKAIKAHPDNPVIQGALSSANAITEANSRLEAYISRPERLADNRIRANAQETLTSINALSQLSPKLAARIEQLSALIEAENQPLPVVVKSDNRTFISVLRVGQVGEVSEKTIHLKPGTYQFEGRREGYQSVIQNVEVSKGDTPTVVTLKCTVKV